MESLIPTVNKIHDIAIAAKTPVGALPQIVIQGDQSSGKSSAIENIVGRSFLPRGKGIVTRCPIIIQMIPTTCIHAYQNGDVEGHSGQQNGVAASDEWVEFLHTNKRFTDFNAVKDEIQAETDRQCGRNKGISKTPITVKIYSPKVVQLTLVDLPGYTRVPVGDQPEDIEKQIRELVLEYIRQPNTIILAVSPAIVDVQTSESIKLAQEVDPTGSRTLLVITKLDLLSEGETYIETLSGKVLDVKLGIIGLVNRSTVDVRTEKTIEAAIRDEKRFFAGRYPRIAHLHGTERLRMRLHELLVQHIKYCLDDIELAISGMIAEAEMELRKLGTAGEEIQDKRRVVGEVISRYCEDVKSEIFGSARNPRTDRVAGKEQLLLLFSETFREVLDEIDPVISATDNDIATAISFSGPIEAIFFVPDGAFRTLVRRPIEDLMEPSQLCAALAHREMKQILYTCADDLKKTRYYFPRLNEALTNGASKLLNERFKMAKEIIETYVNIHADSAFTTDPTFLKKAQDLKAKMDVSPPLLSECHVSVAAANESVNNSPFRKAKAAKSKSSQQEGTADLLELNILTNGNASVVAKLPSTNAAPAQSTSTNGSAVAEPLTIQQRKCDIVRELMRLYFNIVRKCHQDYVPKALLHTVIYYVVENLNTELSALHANQEELERLVEPPADVLEKRRNTLQNLASLKETAEAIPKLRLL